MLLINGKRDKKCTLQFRTQSGIKRSKPKNLTNEQVNSGYSGEQVIDRSGSEKNNDEAC